jgi:hypothetical protein
MSDEEFVRFADGMVGWDLYKEALLRLGRRLDDEKNFEEERKEDDFEHSCEIRDLNDQIGRLESRIDELESAREYS